MGSVGEPVTRPKNVPNDWELVLCENDCGDMVWIPPGMGDTGAVMVCSALCAKQMILKVGHQQP